MGSSLGARGCFWMQKAGIGWRMVIGRGTHREDGRGSDSRRMSLVTFVTVY